MTILDGDGGYSASSPSLMCWLFCSWSRSWLQVPPSSFRTIPASTESGYMSEDTDPSETCAVPAGFSFEYLLRQWSLCVRDACGTVFTVAVAGTHNAMGDVA